MTEITVPEDFLINTTKLIIQIEKLKSPLPERIEDLIVELTDVIIEKSRTIERRAEYVKMLKKR